jgi:hypothetical protein
MVRTILRAIIGLVRVTRQRLQCPQQIRAASQAAMFVVPTLSTLALYLALPQLVRYPLLRTVNRPEFP